MVEKKAAVIFARDVQNVPEDEPILYLRDKWADFDQSLQTDADVIAVAFPEVLGDHYSELIINLGKLADSGKALMISKPSPFMVQQQKPFKFASTRHSRSGHPGRRGALTNNSCVEASNGN